MSRYKKSIPLLVIFLFATSCLVQVNGQAPEAPLPFPFPKPKCITGCRKAITTCFKKCGPGPKLTLQVGRSPTLQAAPKPTTHPTPEPMRDPALPEPLAPKPTPHPAPEPALPEPLAPKPTPHPAPEPMRGPAVKPVPKPKPPGPKPPSPKPPVPKPPAPIPFIPTPECIFQCSQAIFKCITSCLFSPEPPNAFPVDDRCGTEQCNGPEV
ncbi:hypothetical protein ACFE04_029727 [Oxalis oulophora]